MDKAVIEKTLAAFDRVWEKAPDLDRDYIEGQIIGGMIVGIFPLVNINPDGSTYPTGFSIAYRKLGSRKIYTMEIESGTGSMDDETGISFTSGYVEPEELAQMALYKAGSKRF